MMFTIYLPGTFLSTSHSITSSSCWGSRSECRMFVKEEGFLGTHLGKKEVESKVGLRVSQPHRKLWSWDGPLVA